MKRPRALAPLAVGCLLALAPLSMAGTTQGKARVGWIGKTYSPDHLPEAFPKEAGAAVEAWSAWVTEHGYRMELDEPGRVLVIHDQTGSRVRGEMDLVARTSALFDGLLPPPERRAAAAGGYPDASAVGELPEDPEDPLPEDPEAPPPDTGLGGGPERRSEVTKYTWGAAAVEPDTQTAVMLVLKNEKDYAAALELLAKQESYLKEWSEEAANHTGFSIERPLVGAYVENASGQDEWNPDNEFVHRIMRLLVLRRFSQQPSGSRSGCRGTASSRSRARSIVSPTAAVSSGSASTAAGTLHCARGSANARRSPSR